MQVVEDDVAKSRGEVARMMRSAIILLWGWTGEEGDTTYGIGRGPNIRLGAGCQISFPCSKDDSDEVEGGNKP